jgi:hypothetical protein
MRRKVEFTAVGLVTVALADAATTARAADNLARFTEVCPTRCDKTYTSNYGSSGASSA